jgi:hypothetical protein
MDGERAAAIREWEGRPAGEGHEGLGRLAGEGFSGAVEAGGTWALLTNGRIVGVVDGSIDGIDGRSLTAYAAPDDAVPLLFAMQERGGETRASYYTGDTPLEDAHRTLEEGGFTGYVELSENVLSGDYYVVYHGGRSSAVAFVGASRRPLFGDEAFERAAGEVGIYEVIDAPVEVTEIPGVEGAPPAVATGRDDEPTDAGSVADPGPDDETDAAGTSPDDGGETDAADGPDDAETAGAGGYGRTGTGRSGTVRGSEEIRVGAGLGGPEERDDEPDPEPDAGAEPVEATTPITEPEPEPESGSEPAGEPEPEPEPESGSEPAGESESEPADGPGADAGVEPAGDAATDGEQATDAGTATGAGADAATDGEQATETVPAGELDAARAELETARAERDEALSAATELREEVDRLEARIEELEAEIEAHEAAAAERRTPAGPSLGAAEALSGTNLFVRYRSKGEPTLTAAAAGEAERAAVEENLRLESHTTFETEGATVDGEPFESFLESSLAYRFADWVVRDLLYELRTTGGPASMEKLYEAIPEIDRIELDGTVRTGGDGSDDETSAERRFDVVFRNRMGDPLVVAALHDARDPTAAGAVEGLVDDARAVAGGSEPFGTALHVTTSYYEPPALEFVRETTGGGFLSRSRHRSYVRLDRHHGFHVCLVEARAGEFNLSVPDLSP